MEITGSTPSDFSSLLSSFIERRKQVPATFVSTQNFALFVTQLRLFPTVFYYYFSISYQRKGKCVACLLTTCEWKRNVRKQFRAIRLSHFLRRAGINGTLKVLTFTLTPSELEL